jgi:hypothetical protein
MLAGRHRHRLLRRAATAVGGGCAIVPRPMITRRCLRGRSAGARRGLAVVATTRDEAPRPPAAWPTIAAAPGRRGLRPRVGDSAARGLDGDACTTDSMTLAIDTPPRL